MPTRMRLKAGGTVIHFLTMGELADYCGKSKESLKKLTERGIMPEANFRTPKVAIKKGLKKGKLLEGYRLYSRDFLAPKIVEFMKNEVKQGQQITLEQRIKLMNMFQEEREYLLNLP